MIRPLRALALLLAGGLLGGVDDLVAQRDSTSAQPTVAWTTITYLSGATVYLEVGRQHGVREGTAFTVVRGDSVIAELAASYISSNRTACRVVQGAVRLVVGDSVRYIPAREPEPSTLAVAQSGAPAPRRAMHTTPTVRGRVGVRYLVIDQGEGRMLRQPSLDLRLDGAQIGGTPLGLAVDVRMQRTRVTAADGSEIVPVGQTRVYQAALFHQRNRGGSRIALGRQFATALSPLGIFDGLSVDLQGRHWGGGALAGTQPDVATFAPSGDRTEYGVWLQGHSVPGTRSPWGITVGAIGSYDHGEINREFAYLRGTYSSRHLSLYAAQEIDANRGWKRAMASSFATFTSSFVTAQVTVTDALQFSGGLDSRRTVPLYRDFVNPEIAFDDALRQGHWGDVTVRPDRHLRMTAGIRRSDGGDGASQSLTASISATRLTRLGLGLRGRTTQFTGPLSEGRLSSVALEAAPGNRWRLSLNAGLRTSGSPGAPATTRLTWFGGDLDLSINRSVYLLLSTYRESGAPTASIQSYASLTWRF